MLLRVRRALRVVAFWGLTAGCSRGLSSAMEDAPVGSSAAPVGPPVFIENDYRQAREEALRRGVPLVVFGWSPWCTDCLGMKAYVFSEPALTCLGTRSVWLALDTDREQNGDFWGRFPIESTPTLWVLDPERQRPALVHAGPLALPDLQALLEDVELRATPRGPFVGVSSASASGSGRPPPSCPGIATASASASASASPPAPGPTTSAAASGSVAASASAPPPLPPARDPELEAVARLREALQAEADSNPRAAEHAYRQALQAPRRWPRRAQAVDGLQQLLGRRDLRGCVDLAAQELPELPVGTFAASIAQRALRCAQHLDERGHPSADRAALAVEALAHRPSQAWLPSQRSHLYEDAVRFFRDSGDAGRAQRLSREWLGFLELEATLARTADQRAVFDEHRLRASREVGSVAHVLPVLEQTARERPTDASSQVRLARALVETKRRPEALARLRLALPDAQGQGRLRASLLLADLQRDPPGNREACQTLTAALAQAEREPPPLDDDRQMRELRRMVDSLACTRQP